MFGQSEGRNRSRPGLAVTRADGEGRKPMTVPSHSLGCQQSKSIGEIEQCWRATQSSANRSLNSLLAGKIQGKIANFVRIWPHRCSDQPIIQWVKEEFPARPNREFLGAYRDRWARGRGRSGNAGAGRNIRCCSLLLRERSLPHGLRDDPARGANSSSARAFRKFKRASAAALPTSPMCHGRSRRAAPF